MAVVNNAVTPTGLRRLLDHEAMAAKECRLARREVGTYFQRLRRALGLQVVEVAKATGLKGRNVIAIESGREWSDAVARRLTDFYAFHATQAANEMRDF